MFNKKGIVTTSVYILILLILILVLIGTYYFYSEKKGDVIKLEYEKEIFLSLSKFRSKIITLIEKGNSSLVYNDSYSKNSIKIYLVNKTISGQIIEDDGFAMLNISSLGIIFCSNYTFYPVETNTFTYNGSCVGLI